MMLAVALKPSLWFRSRLIQAGKIAATGLGLTGSVVQVLETEAGSGIGDNSIQNWQGEQGLPPVSLTSITQTPDSHLRLGTFNGALRFDEARLAVIDTFTTPELSNNGSTHFLVDWQGTPWIVASTGGLVRMAVRQFRRILRKGAKLISTGAAASSRSKRRVLLRDNHSDRPRVQNDRLKPVASEPLTNDIGRVFLENRCVGSATREGKSASGANHILK